MKTKLFTKLILLVTTIAINPLSAEYKMDYSSFIHNLKEYNSWDYITRLVADSTCLKAEEEAREKYPNEPYKRLNYQTFILNQTTKAMLHNLKEDLYDE